MLQTTSADAGASNLHVYMHKNLKASNNIESFCTAERERQKFCFCIR